MTRRQLIIETTSVVISIIFIALGFILSQGSPEPWYVILFFGLSFSIGGFAKAKEGIIATLKNKSLNVEILMILAALGAFIVGDYFEGAILILIFSISGVLESYATSKSEKALTSLLKLAPKTALLYHQQQETEVLVSTLKVGDQVIVKVGSQVPVDGIIVEGSSALNQAAITGEFVPVTKTMSEEVFAGSINIESTIIVETSKDPKDSVVQRIVDFVEKAQAQKTKSQSFIDRFETYYVYIVILMAITLMVVPPLFGWWDQAYAFNRGIIVLVVGSPCALVASITPAILSALSFGARHRILIKGGDPLENMIGVKAVVMDKTGTITTGVPNVAKIELLDGLDKNFMLSVLYTLERQSTHPLAKAVADHLEGQAELLKVHTVEVSGRGMTADIDGHTYKIGRFEANIPADLQSKIDQCNAKGHSQVLIIKDHDVIGYVALMDTIRTEAKSVIKDLKSMGITPILLTGDHKFTAKSIAEQVGITQYIYDCLPEDKVTQVQQFKKTYGKVVMVGDGINDAPALASSDVSIAMGSATDVSLETSDMVVMNDRLENIPRVIKLSKRVRRITLQNIMFSTSVIIFLLISNIFGVIELPTGVIAHEMSTILVILNSLRLLIK